MEIRRTYTAQWVVGRRFDRLQRSSTMCPYARYMGPCSCVSTMVRGQREAQLRLQFPLPLLSEMLRVGSYIFTRNFLLFVSSLGSARLDNSPAYLDVSVLLRIVYLLSRPIIAALCITRGKYYRTIVAVRTLLHLTGWWASDTIRIPLCVTSAMSGFYQSSLVQPGSMSELICPKLPSRFCASYSPSRLLRAPRQLSRHYCT